MSDEKLRLSLGAAAIVMLAAALLLYVDLRIVWPWWTRFEKELSDTNAIFDAVVVGRCAIVLLIISVESALLFLLAKVLSIKFKGQ